MGFGVDAVVDGDVGGEEALGGALRFELLVLSLSASDWEMGIVSPFVLLKTARAMAIR